MGFRVVIAAALPSSLDGVTPVEWEAVSRAALPTGFRYVVTDSQEIVEPILIYLHDKCRRSARILSVGNTQAALCADLYEWFSFLDVIQLRWDTVDITDIEEYRDRLLSSISPKTGQPYAVSTVRRRLTTIFDFYKWARRCELTGHEVRSADTRATPRNFDRNALAHTQAGDSTSEINLAMPRAYVEDQVDALTLIDLRQVLHELGPMNGDANDHRPRRDRIIATLAVSTGMRLDECASLTLAQFLGLARDPHYGNYPLRLTKTKGLRPRTVMLPAGIHDEIQAYVDGERSEAVHGQRRPGAVSLFVNGFHATRNRGGPITPHTIWRHFHEAVIAAGLVRTIQRDGLPPITVAAHSFHDLRHTFALVMYFELRRAGKAEPWLALKNLLGHRHLTTTINTYLRSVQTQEAVITDLLHDYLKALRDG